MRKKCGSSGVPTSYLTYPTCQLDLRTKRSRSSWQLLCACSSRRCIMTGIATSLLTGSTVAHQCRQVQAFKSLPHFVYRRCHHHHHIVRFRSQSPRRCARLRTQAGLKIVENFNAAFELQADAEAALHKLLSSESFCQQVVKECHLSEASQVKFSGQLFQPVPWSVTTRKGMPAEFEKYSDNPKYTIINIPPNFMFQAKVFKPSRLCAIYECL